MRERPILFSAPMVRALLDGTKTQTRRVCKTAPIADARFVGGHYFPGKHKGAADISVEAPYVGLAGPYGQPGDRLWVREAWARTTVFPGTSWMVVYREGDNRTDYGGPWKPGIHMFRRDSRITLEVTGVRVQRLQDISEEDALAEGITYQQIPNNGLDPARARTWYRGLWDQINGAGAWSANPWVWVVEFKRLSTKTS